MLIANITWSINSLSIAVPTEGWVIQLIESTIIAALEDVASTEIGECWSWADHIEVFVSGQQYPDDDVVWIFYLELMGTLLSNGCTVFEYYRVVFVGIADKYGRIFTNLYFFVGLNPPINFQLLHFLWSFFRFTVIFYVCPNTITQQGNISIRINDLQASIFHPFSDFSLGSKCPTLFQLMAMPDDGRIRIKQNCKFLSLDANFNWCALISFLFLLTGRIHHSLQIMIMFPKQVITPSDFMKTIVCLRLT